MKKSLVTLVTIFVIMMFGPLYSLAAEENVSFKSVFPDNIPKGNIVEIRMKIDAENGYKVSAFGGKILFNNKKFEFVEFHRGGLLSCWDKSSYSQNNNEIIFDFKCSEKYSFHYLSKKMKNTMVLKLKVLDTYVKDDVSVIIDAFTGFDENGNKASYAVYTETEPFLSGDINTDLKITLSDAMSVFQYVAGKADLNGSSFSAADIDRDGRVALNDAMTIFQHVAGKISPEHNQTIASVPATCTEQGYSEYKCSCGECLKYDYIKPLGHGLGEWYFIQKPTPISSGVKERKCSRCGFCETVVLDPVRDPVGKIRYYNQKDPKWGGKEFIGCGNMFFNGCAPTAVAMALSYRGITIDPRTVADWLYYNTEEFNRSFTGTSGSGIRLAAEQYGAKVVKIETYLDFITNLRNGAAIAGAMGEGLFAKPGKSHCIFMVGFEDGNVNCYDPYYENKNGVYNAWTVWSQRSTLSVDLRYDNIVFYAIY